MTGQIGTSGPSRHRITTGQLLLGRSTPWSPCSWQGGLHLVAYHSHLPIHPCQIEARAIQHLQFWAFYRWRFLDGLLVISTGYSGGSYNLDTGCFFLLVPPIMFKYGTGPSPRFSNWTPPTQNVIKFVKELQYNT